MLLGTPREIQPIVARLFAVDKPYQENIQHAQSTCLHIIKFLAYNLSYLLIMFLSFLVTHLVEVLMLLCSLPNEISEFIKWTTCTGSTLTLRNGSRRRVRDESHVLSRPSVSISIDRATAGTRHLLHTYVAEERDEVGHAPGASPVDVVGGKLLTGIR